MGRIKLTQDQFILKAESIHGNIYDYSKAIYKSSFEHVIIICKIHGEFLQKPTAHIHQGRGCPRCGRKISTEKKKNKNSSTYKELFVVKSIKIHGNRYIYDKTDYISAMRKVVITCIVHGDFQQTPNRHLSGNGCSKCADEKRSKNNTLTTDKYIEKAKDIHGNRYDYSSVKYKNTKSKITIKCPVHGNFRQVAGSHLENHGCPKCKSSKGENRIRVYLEKNNIKYELEKTFENCRNTRPLRFDFYLPDHNLLIEFNGKQHYEFVKKYHRSQKGFELHKKRDSIKISWAQENNIELFIISYEDMDQIDNILNNVMGRVK